ncbi:hypothetical protein [Kineosporia sp. A_224]|uniref:hypothetical protein n=1 Tax=Kineosporia sp. A_224 TaxID=1962180 RepID=UPI001179CA60|nr:hypothetical protein [Kineosporia sp. A_224]
MTRLRGDDPRLATAAVAGLLVVAALLGGADDAFPSGSPADGADAATTAPAPPPGAAPAPVVVTAASTPVVTASATTAAPSPTTAAAAGTPVPAGARRTVRLRLALRSRPGDAAVEVAATASGFAPRGLDAATGGLTPDAGVQAVHVDFGDGTQENHLDGAASATTVCTKGAPLGVLTVGGVLRHSYARPGRYTLTYSLSTCATGSAQARTTSRDLVVRVSEPPPPADGVALGLREASPGGDRVVELSATAYGTAPRGVDPGTGRTSAHAAVLGVEVDFGDGTLDDSSGAGVRCDPAAPAGTLSFTDTRRHTYTRAGRFTVTYTLLTCTPGGSRPLPTTRTVEVSVR